MKLLAIDTWREFRVVRAESASIDLLHSAINDPASYPELPPEPLLPIREFGWETLTVAHRILSAFQPENDPAELAEEEAWGTAVDVLNYFGCQEEIPPPEEGGWTKSKFQAALQAVVREDDVDMADHITYALVEIEQSYEDLCKFIEERNDVIDRHNAAVKPGGVSLKAKQILATAAMEATVLRVEAHLSRRKERTLAQLELLQRASSGEKLPLLRLHVSDE